MRISDGSSDVCSSDLILFTEAMRQRVAENSAANFAELKAIQRKLSGWSAAAFASGLAALAMTWYILVFLIARPVTTLVGAMRRIATGDTTAAVPNLPRSEERRVGTRGSVRVELGGRRIKKKQ